ncbi:MAG: hypothetical protein LUI10_09270 [Lachnospiraceae bacterium]|nr:hypothetical protein [Lachnospiraceae bacterium]
MRTLLQMSLTGCYCVPVVLAVRFLLIKVLHSPRRYVYVLWLVVFLNLCLPFSLRVPVSLVPGWLSNPAAFLSAETESGKDASVSGVDNDVQAGVIAETGDDAQAGDDAKTNAAEADNGTEAAGDAAWASGQITTLFSANDAAEEEENRENQAAAASEDATGLAAIRVRIGNLLQIPAYVVTLLESASRKAANAATVILSWPGLFSAWLAGLFLVLFYQGIVTIKMCRLLRAGRRAEGKERIYIVRNLSSPCLWGLFRPVICLPESLEETERDYILCHERCHKKRGDHIVKWVLFLITAIHWFNPFIWLAYSFCCKDMEISCDEAVLGQTGEDVRKAYAASLLKYAARQNGYLFAPLTFGEPSLRSRVSNILHYRKQGTFVCGAALVIVLLVGAGLFLWAGNSGVGNTEESADIEEAMEAGISDDEEAEDYQITGILMGAYGVCSYDSSSEDKESLSELLWLAPRRYDHVDGTDYMEVIADIDRLTEGWDETGSYVTYTEDFPVFIRYYMKSYMAPDGVNAIDHKDIILLKEGDDMIVCIQKPDDESEWIFYLAPDYGDWLLKEVELCYRIRFPELFSETAASDQEETFLSDEERYAGLLVSREEYPGLYEAAEALLEAHEASAAQQADGFEKTVALDSIHIFREGLSDEVFVITATALTGLAADDEVRLSFGVRLDEDSAYGMEIVDEIEVTNDDTQERLTAFVQYIMENVAGPVYMGYQLIYMDDDSCPELIVSGPDEATGFLILHYNDGTVYATQSNRLYYSYIPYGNLLLNAEGNMGLYTDDVYSIVDGQVTLIATGYRGLWAMHDGEIEWSGDNLDEDRYYWEGEELSEEEYAAALEAVYPSEQAVECDDIPYYSYREIVALLDESYLKEIPAPKG